MMTKKRKILFNENIIHDRIVQLANEIDDFYDGKDFVLISLLRGSFIFAADLVREIKSMVNIDFITTSSYDNEKISSGFVKIVYDLREDIENKDILIVDDILDSGKTMLHVVNYLKKRNPASIKTCVLLDKPSRRTEDINADFIGFTIEDVFIVGYGLNYGDYYRNIPYIFTFDE